MEKGGKTMKRIGIIACANTTKVLDCPLSPCLRDFYDRKGEFARYKEIELELAGIVSCPGCFGGLVPEAILSKAHSLIHYGVDAIHLTYCMKVFCPYVKIYKKILNDKYPETEIIVGTHEPHDPIEVLKKSISDFLKKKVGECIIP